MKKEKYVYLLMYGFTINECDVFGVYTSRYKANKALEKHSQDGYLLSNYRVKTIVRSVIR